MRAFFSTYLTIVAVAALASCSSSANTPTPAVPGGSSAATTTTTVTYTQIERLARPAVKEATQSYDQHDSTARANPYADPTLPTAITTFMTTVAGRSSATANALQSVLIPDETVADLSQLGPGVKAAYLGVETGGVTGSKFGGRKLEDDVISIDLGAIFGNTLSKLGLVADDGKESPCLTTDNVAGSSQAVTGASFPYLQAPN